MPQTMKTGLINATVTAGYVVAVSSLMFYGSNLMGTGTDTVFMPIMMLMLLVCSAAFVGAMIFGRPLLWYIDGRKKEALQVLGYTFGFLFAFMIIAFAIGVISSR